MQSKFLLIGNRAHTLLVFVFLGRIPHPSLVTIIIFNTYFVFVKKIKKKIEPKLFDRANFDDKA